MSYKHTRVACYFSSITQATVNNFLPLLFVMFNTRFGVSLTQLSFVVFLNFVVQLGVDLTSIKIVKYISTRTAVVAAQFFCAAGFLLLGVLPQIMGNVFLAVCVSTVVSAVGSGLIEVMVSPLMLRVSENKGRSFMSFLHSFYCWGTILVVFFTTLAIKFFGDDVWVYATFFWGLIPLCNAFFFMRVPVVEDINESERTPVKSLMRKPSFLMLVGLILTAGAAEVVIASWASTFAETTLNLPKFTGDILGPCAFAFFMGLGRILSSFLSEKISTRKMLTFCAVVATACYLIAAFSDNSIIAVLACALCGLGVSIMWPASCSLAGEMFPSGGNAMFGVLATSGDIGCIVGPWLAGLIAARNDFKIALAVCTVFPLLHLIILIASKIKSYK